MCALLIGCFIIIHFYAEIFNTKFRKLFFYTSASLNWECCVRSWIDVNYNSLYYLVLTVLGSASCWIVVNNQVMPRWLPTSQFFLTRINRCTWQKKKKLLYWEKVIYKKKSSKEICWIDEFKATAYLKYMTH